MDAKQEKNYVELDLGGKVPLKSWVPAEEVYADGELLKQARNGTNHPAVAGPVALMPDTHQGFGVPIGSVIALDGGVSPYMVGVDIGCGMAALRVDAEEAELHAAIENHVLPLFGQKTPLGAGGHHDRAAKWRGMPASVRVSDATDAAAYQLGTLGSGNHFQEAGVDAEGRVWLVVHSGSRRVGLEVAKHYHALALAMNRAGGVELPHEDLSYLPEGTPEFEAYSEALAWCLDWAFENRRLMGRAMVTALSEVLGREVGVEGSINVHHNMATRELVGDRYLWVHRKGATSAAAGERSLVPGHMGHGSYVCTGLGSEDSYASSSHGAGRKLGRNQAKRTLDVELEKAKLDRAGVTLWTPGGYKTVLDEMPGAYKDPAEVMGRQSDLVRVEGLIRSVGAVKA